MTATDIFRRVAQKGSRKEEMAEEAAGNPAMLSALVTGLNHQTAAIKFGCAKILRFVSEKYPAVLYPRIEVFIRLLQCSNTFIRCDAARIIANLCAVDTENRFESIFEKFFAPITGTALIPAANVIGCASSIALAKPVLSGPIVCELLKAEKAKYTTPECHNIVLGHTIQSFDRFFDQIEDKAAIARFVRKQLRNSRPATRKKAEVFVRKHGL